MSTSETTGTQNQLRSIGWWASVFLGLLAGTTLTWIRTQRNFFFIGAVIIAVVIVIIGMRTIRRRARFPQMAQAHTSWPYAVWTMVLLVLVGPIQLVYVADDPGELMLKSIILSTGFCVAIHELDRAMIKATRKYLRQE
ncbi:hypothetical protein [Glutamicibacter sp. AOP5-A2-18]|uniref:hypothetical protein n=1 Tax=Glutamicibacter sp. AOP5-A2-18 TaxID=3457656 RepID=UPI004034A61E